VRLRLAGGKCVGAEVAASQGNGLASGGAAGHSVARVQLSSAGAHTQSSRPAAKGRLRAG